MKSSGFLESLFSSNVDGFGGFARGGGGSPPKSNELLILLVLETFSKCFTAAFLPTVGNSAGALAKRPLLLLSNSLEFQFQLEFSVLKLSFMFGGRADAVAVLWNG